ncbi:MAG: protein phosphatase [Cyanobacteriota bacterium]
MPEAPLSQVSAGPAPPWQPALFRFAITELVRQHRESFQPLWTVDSWAKLLIWLALSSGCSTDQAALEGFAAGLGPTLSRALRQVFFSRDLEDLNLRLLADPAEEEVLALPLDALAAGPEPAGVRRALEQVGLSGRVAPPERWRQHEALIALPWWRPAAPCD